MVRTMAEANGQWGNGAEGNNGCRIGSRQVALCKYWPGNRRVPVRSTLDDPRQVGGKNLVGGGSRVTGVKIKGAFNETRTKAM
jgi:hypothetical protein